MLETPTPMPHTTQVAIQGSHKLSQVLLPGKGKKKSSPPIAIFEENLRLKYFKTIVETFYSYAYLTFQTAVLASLLTRFLFFYYELPMIALISVVKV